MLWGFLLGAVPLISMCFVQAVTSTSSRETVLCNKSSLPGAVPLNGMCIVQVLVGKLPYVVGFSARCCAFKWDMP